MQGKVKLDVGGKLFSTTISTLTKYPDSMLGAMFSGRYDLQKNEEDCVFIDRDPKYFRYVLDFLRNDEIDYPSDKVEVKKIYRELEYFGLKEIIGVNIGRDFVYVSDADMNGVFTYLLAHGMKPKFEVTSDHGSIHGNIDSVINMSQQQVWQISQGMNAWFSLMFKEGLSFLPNRYTIRHRNDFNDTALRNWILYGWSQRSNTWEIIKSHVNDTSLPALILSTFTWGLDCHEYYTGFKILQNGHSSGNYNHFNISNIEFYGLLQGE